MNFDPGLDKEKRSIDHMNIIPLDNWKTNLRIVSQTIQNINRRKQSNNTSEKNGVSFNKTTNRWRARFYLYGKETCKYFPVGPEENGYEIAKKKAIAYRKKMENEIPEYKEALLTKPGYVPIQFIWKQKILMKSKKIIKKY